MRPDTKRLPYERPLKTSLGAIGQGLDYAAIVAAVNAACLARDLREYRERGFDAALIAEICGGRRHIAKAQLSVIRRVLTAPEDWRSILDLCRRTIQSTRASFGGAS